LITSFNQMHGLLEAPIIQHCRQHHVNCVWQRYDPQYCLQNKLELNTKDITNQSNKKENMSRIPYEYKVGDQVLLETPGILRKSSSPRTGPYPVTNVNKNDTIRIQKGTK
jgi:hypothetical protein